MAPNSWLAPQYDPGQMAQELQRAVNSRGGVIDQSLLYVDPQSALRWLQLSRSSRYLTSWDTSPIQSLALDAQQILAPHRPPVEIIALGCGDARIEVRFALHLRQAMPQVDMQLRLLDISHVLLAAAHDEAVRGLAGSRVEVTTMHANFHRLPRYTELALAPSSRTRRIWTLCGYTVSNLDSEAAFFDNLGACSRPDDLLLLDLQLAAGSPEDVASGTCQDPLLKAEYSVDDYLPWLTDPFARHCTGFSSVEISRQFEVGVVPGSYAINWHAKVLLTTGAQRSFVVARSRRYSLPLLLEWMSSRGWAQVSARAYGPNARAAAVLLTRSH